MQPRRSSTRMRLSIYVCISPVSPTYRVAYSSRFELTYPVQATPGMGLAVTWQIANF